MSTLRCYCKDCGSPNEYISKKPNFCETCGSAFNAVTALARKPAPVIIVPRQDSPPPQPPARPVRQRTVAHRPVEEEDAQYADEEYEESEYVPDLSSLDVEIEVREARGEAMRNIAVNRKGGGDYERPKPKAPKTKKERKAFLDEFRKEAGTLRKK